MCWLTTLIHAGDVYAYPFHTLAVLYVTLGPVYDEWAGRYKADPAVQTKKTQANNEPNSASPSSVPANSDKSDLPMFNLSATEK